jgi:hypothetical protein
VLRSVLISLCSLLVLCIGSGARAADTGPTLFVTLDYGAEAALRGCPDEGAFKALVVGQLGYDPFRPDAPHRVFVRMSDEVGELRGLVEWRDASGKPRGQRELSGKSGACAELARAMSFATVVQIQLLAREAEAEAEASRAAAAPVEQPATEKTPKPPAPPAPDDEGERSPAASESDRAVDAAAWQLILGGGAVFGVGVAPRALFEGRLFGALRHSRLALELGVETGLPSSHVTSADEGFEQHVVLGVIAGCFAISPASVCVVNKWGRLWVGGFGVDDPKSSSGLASLLGLRLGLEQHLAPRWLAALRLEALATLAPWRVELDGEEIWRAPVAAVFVGADLAVIAGIFP